MLIPLQVTSAPGDKGTRFPAPFLR